jgi:hypothetical protein
MSRILLIALPAAPGARTLSALALIPGGLLLLRPART